jgi:hypothetical protein
MGLACWLALIGARGYGIGTLIELARFTTDMTLDKGVSVEMILKAICAYQTLFTPGFLLLGVWGWLCLNGASKRIATFGILGMAFAIFGMRWSGPKMVVAFMPPVAVCVVAGFCRAWHGGSRKYAMRTAIGFVLLVPWLVGVRVTYGDSAWGPGFEVRPYDAPPAGTTASFVVGGGSAFPTSEGPRPLFGHAAVLLGGQWRTLISQLECERREALQVSVQQNLPFMILQGANGYAVAELAGMGLTTKDRHENSHSQTLNELRRFSNDRDKRLVLMRLKVPVQDVLKSESLLREIVELAGGRMVVHGYPSTLRRVYQSAPEGLEKLGTSTAIWEPARLVVGSTSETSPHPRHR